MTVTGDASQLPHSSHGLKTRVTGQRCFRAFPLLTGFIAALLLLASGVRAENGPTTRPLLEELNRQTITVYHQVGAGIYRVRLPEPKWIKAYAMAAMTRWDKSLDPEIRKRLEEEPPVPVEADASGSSIVVRPKQGTGNANEPSLGGDLRMPAPPKSWSESNIALLLDSDGDLLVPLYVEPEVIHGKPLDVIGPDGSAMTATFIGSDRPTNLTLLRIDKPAGAPVRLGANRPESGSLVLQLSCADGSGRLALWTGQRESGVIVTIDGQVSGIARAGQFLSGSACRLIARQLIQYGSVQRATLGVLITEIQPNEKSTSPAMRIDQVIAGSAAEKAGLRAGDLVLGIGGEPVSDIPSFAAAIVSRDGPTALHVRRGTQDLVVTVILEQRK
ncbi:MAG TPA: PDZ domain-containing protein [Tepidisphaeraceae bacterium]|nr:PDZ domain-containing protein [Tepidisphaeraceae bacterium]